MFVVKKVVMVVTSDPPHPGVGPFGPLPDSGICMYSQVVVCYQTTYSVQFVLEKGGCF